MIPVTDSPAVVAWHALMEAHERVMSELRPVLRQHGLTVSEFDVLANLLPGEQCRHSELADRVVLSRTALTRLIDRLVGRGLLLRLPDARDGRGVQIRLTHDGADLRRAALEGNDRVIEAAFAGLSGHQTAALERSVRRLGA